MGIFGEGRNNWKLISADEKVKNYLQKIGFKIFSADGEYFLDELGNKYGAWSDLLHVEEIEEVENGKKYHEVIRGVRDVNLEQDVYQFFHNYSQCWIGKMCYDDEFFFLGGKCPSPTRYNASIVTPVATWREDGIDGGGQRTLYSLIMLNSREKRRTRFIRNLTPEEQELRDLELSVF